MPGFSQRALRRQRMRLNVTRIAKQLNCWLATGDQFQRFEVTGELFPRGTARSVPDLKFLVENEGRFYTKKLCLSVIKELLSENGYRPVRQMGENWIDYCRRQADKMQTLCKNMKLSERVHRCLEKKAWQKWHARSIWDQSWEDQEEWDNMDMLDTCPMDQEVARTSDLQLICWKVESVYKLSIILKYI